MYIYVETRGENISYVRERAASVIGRLIQELIPTLTFSPSVGKSRANAYFHFSKFFMRRLKQYFSNVVTRHGVETEN